MKSYDPSGTDGPDEHAAHRSENGPLGDQLVPAQQLREGGLRGTARRLAQSLNIWFSATNAYLVMSKLALAVSVLPCRRGWEITPATCSVPIFPLKP